MEKIKIFLSGSVKKDFQDLNIGKKYWEQDEEKILKEKLLFDVELLNPNSITIDKSDRENRFRKDFEMLLQSHMILVDATNKKGIGVGAEMALAKNWKIPIYTISPVESHYRKINTSGNEWIHPFIYELSDRIFSSLDEFINYANELYQHCRLPSQRYTDLNDILDKLNSFDSGYDEGYKVVSNFWGHHPADMVVKCAELLLKDFKKNDITCLDLGCGHGKNSLYLNEKGFIVDAIDSSYWAIKEAKQYNSEINWKVRDIRKIYSDNKKYQAVIMTGCLHCLATKDEVIDVVHAAQQITCIGGYHVVSVFNSKKQNLAGHSQDFHPILLTHEDYLSMYKDWEILLATDVIQEDIHSHNNIIHEHSITRILARKK